MPRTSSQNRAIREAKTQSILEVALELFALHGFDKVSIDQIADACKMSHGLFYHYFSSKNEILENLVTDYGNKFSQNLLNRYKQGDEGEVFIKKSLNLFLNNVNSNKRNCYYASLFIDTSLVKLNEDLDTPIFDRELENVLNKSLKIIKKETSNFSQKEFDSFLYLFFIYLKGYVDAKLKYPNLVKNEPSADDLLRLINYGLKGSSDNQEID